MYDGLHRLALDGKILSAHTVGQGGIAAAVSLMAFGNRLGVKLNPDWETYPLFLPEYGSIIIEVDDTFNADELPACAHPLGVTTKDNFIEACGERVMLDDAIAAWQAPLSDVFPEKDGRAPVKVGYEKYTERSAHRPAVKIAKPRVLVPVFPGTNCEYDTQRAFERAGAKVDVALIRNLSQADVEQSVEELVKLINSANIIALPGGFSGGDEPDGSAKFIAATLRNPAIADAIMEMLNKRDGLMLGICNGFQALIKLGLVPYGEIRPEAQGGRRDAYVQHAGPSRLRNRQYRRHLGQVAVVQLRQRGRRALDSHIARRGPLRGQRRYGAQAACQRSGRHSVLHARRRTRFVHAREPQRFGMGDRRYHQPRRPHTGQDGSLRAHHRRSGAQECARRKGISRYSAPV